MTIRTLCLSPKKIEEELFVTRNFHVAINEIRKRGKTFFAVDQNVYIHIYPFR